MTKYKIEYAKKGCIGSGVCEAFAPDHWEVDETRKAKLKGDVAFNEETQMYEKTIDEDDLEDNKMAADGCPRLVIHITNLETGKKIA